MKAVAHCVGGLAIATCFIAATAALSQAPSPAEVARSSIIYIYLDVTNSNTGAISRVQGTGFIISKTGYVLTAAHLLKEWSLQRDVDKSHNPIRSSLIDKPGLSRTPALFLSIVDPGNPDGPDVALLKLPDLGDYAVTPVCTSRIPDLGENFVAYGFPHDNPFQPVPGTLGTNNGPGGRYAAASDFDEGMSGGPIYNGKGAVEGLVKGGLDTAAVRWITPIQFAAPLLAIARVSESCDPSTPPWSLDNCRADSEAAQREFAIDPSNIVRVDKLIQCRNPIGYHLRGADSFYRGKYREAARDFELSLQNLPMQAGDVVRPMWQSDLGDAYIEIGRISDAIALYGQVLDATRSDLARFGLGRAYLYAGRGVSEDYDKAIEQLQGIDPTFRGQIEPGGAQIALSAAQIGRKDDTRMNKQQKSAMTAEAKSNLCAGIKKSEDFWRAVLNGTKPLVHFSFKEEIRLTGELGGGKIRC